MKNNKDKCKIHPWCEKPCPECELYEEERERELRKEHKRKRKQNRNRYDNQGDGFFDEWGEE